MQLLPNAESAIVDVVKLTNYILNSEHEEGKHMVTLLSELPDKSVQIG